MNKIIKTGVGYNNTGYREIMVDSEADLANIETWYLSPGSIAYTCKTGEPAMKNMWMWNGEAWCSL